MPATVGVEKSQHRLLQNAQVVHLKRTVPSPRCRSGIDFIDSPQAHSLLQPQISLCSSVVSDSILDRRHHVRRQRDQVVVALPSSFHAIKRCPIFYALRDGDGSSTNVGGYNKIECEDDAIMLDLVNKAQIWDGLT